MVVHTRQKSQWRDDPRLQYLRVKGRVRDHGVDKHQQVIFDHKGPYFELGTLVFALAAVLGDVFSKSPA